MDAREFGHALMDYATAWPPMARPTTRAPFVGYPRRGAGMSWGLVITRPVALSWADGHHSALSVELRRRRKQDAVLELFAEETRVIHLVDTVTREVTYKDPPWFWVHKNVVRVKLWHVTPEGRRHATLDGPDGRRLEFDL